jgi:hypothetical protein
VSTLAVAIRRAGTAEAALMLLVHSGTPVCATHARGASTRMLCPRTIGGAARLTASTTRRGCRGNARRTPRSAYGRKRRHAAEGRLDRAAAASSSPPGWRIAPALRQSARLGESLVRPVSLGVACPGQRPPGVSAAARSFHHFSTLAGSRCRSRVTGALDARIGGRSQSECDHQLRHDRRDRIGEVAVLHIR